MVICSIMYIHGEKGVALSCVNLTLLEAELFLPPPAQRPLVLLLSLRSLHHTRNFPFLGYEKEMIQ